MNFNRTLDGANMIDATSLNLPANVNAVRINGDFGTAGQVLAKDSNNRLNWSRVDEVEIPDNSIAGNKLKDNITFSTTSLIRANQFFSNEFIVGQFGNQDIVLDDVGLTMAGSRAIVLTNGTLSVGGNTTLSGNTDFVGNLTSTNGNITMTNGDITLTNGTLFANVEGTITEEIVECNKLIIRNAETPVANPIVEIQDAIDFRMINSSDVEVFNIDGATGDIIQVGDLSSVSGNIGLTNGAVNLTNGNITLNNGDLSIGGSTTLNGTTSFVGDMSSTNGNITLSTGNITLTTGDITLTDGELSSYTIDFTSTINSTNGDITLTNGGITLANGNIEIGGTTTLNGTTSFVGNMSSTNGNVDLVNGNLFLDNGTAFIGDVGGGNHRITLNGSNGRIDCETLNNSGNYTSTAGNITLTTGDLTIGGDTTLEGLTMNGSMTSTDGNITLTNGDLTIGGSTTLNGTTDFVGNMTSTNGNITMTNGNITLTNGVLIGNVNGEITEELIAGQRLTLRKDPSGQTSGNTQLTMNVASGETGYIDLNYSSGSSGNSGLQIYNEGSETFKLSKTGSINRVQNILMYGTAFNNVNSGNFIMGVNSPIMTNQNSAGNTANDKLLIKFGSNVANGDDTSQILLREDNFNRVNLTGSDGSVRVYDGSQNEKISIRGSDGAIRLGLGAFLYNDKASTTQEMIIDADSGDIKCNTLTTKGNTQLGYNSGTTTTIGRVGISNQTLDVECHNVDLGATTGNQTSNVLNYRGGLHTFTGEKVVFGQYLGFSLLSCNIEGRNHTYLNEYTNKQKYFHLDGDMNTHTLKGTTQEYSILRASAERQIAITHTAGFSNSSTNYTQITNYNLTSVARSTTCRIHFEHFIQNATGSPDIYCRIDSTNSGKTAYASQVGGPLLVLYTGFMGQGNHRKVIYSITISGLFPETTYSFYPKYAKKNTSSNIMRFIYGGEYGDAITSIEWLDGEVDKGSISDPYAPASEEEDY
jgi:hypothetical protein